MGTIIRGLCPADCMRSRFSENRERKSDKSEGFKTNAVVSVLSFILSNKKG